jgi:hypothetical protein
MSLPNVGKVLQEGSREAMSGARRLARHVAALAWLPAAAVFWFGCQFHFSPEFA